MIKNNKISENFILNKYFSKLNFNKKETFNFKNDGAVLKIKRGKEIL